MVGVNRIAPNVRNGHVTLLSQIAESARHPTLRDPLQAALQRPETAVLAVITDVFGASYRLPGTMMTLFADGDFAGGLTNGCIEGDLAHHAAECLRGGNVARLRYGAGSPFFDIRLPCGGALEVALYPRPNARALAETLSLRSARKASALCFGADGGLASVAARPTGWAGTDFAVAVQPEIRVEVFGEGPEAAIFSHLLQSAGYLHCLTTPSEPTRDMAALGGCNVRLDLRDDALDPQAIDARTAVVAFFHDHGREISILQAALSSPAFYIGAQGSRQVAARRCDQLADLGVAPAALQRLHGPIGLIPSARDARTLAVSVLAEIIATAEQRAGISRPA